MPGGLRAEILLVGALAAVGLALGLLSGHVWAGLSLGLALVVMRLWWVVALLVGLAAATCGLDMMVRASSPSFARQ